MPVHHGLVMPEENAKTELADTSANVEVIEMGQAVKEVDPTCIFNSTHLLPKCPVTRF